LPPQAPGREKTNVRDHPHQQTPKTLLKRPKIGQTNNMRVLLSTRASRKTKPSETTSYYYSKRLFIVGPFPLLGKRHKNRPRTVPYDPTNPLP
ncbi:hypothetical protein CRENBAI_004974, partial [Crenichthys baileyi]